VISVLLWFSSVDLCGVLGVSLPLSLSPPSSTCCWPPDEATIISAAGAAMGEIPHLLPPKPEVPHGGNETKRIDNQPRRDALCPLVRGRHRHGAADRARAPQRLHRAEHLSRGRALVRNRGGHLLRGSFEGRRLHGLRRALRRPLRRQ